jgi:putative solute:sodium symporter small subunit
MSATADRHAYWQRTRRLTAALFLVWLVVGLGLHFFAHALNFSFFGWPFSFWMAAQGSLLVFALLVGVYAWRMERLDREYGLAEEED